MISFLNQDDWENVVNFIGSFIENSEGMWRKRSLLLLTTVMEILTFLKNKEKIVITLDAIN